MTRDRKSDPNDAYLATLHSSSLTELLKRSAARFAAVTGSAMALATNASAGTDIRDIAAHNAALISSVLLESQSAASPQTSQLIGPGIAAIFPVDGAASIIQPGEWVTIYGYNLASGAVVWNGNFPTSLGGTSVEINGKAAFLSFVSPGQINLQAPDNTTSGVVSVVVTTSGGTAKGTVTLNQVSPSFLLLNSSYIAAIILRSDGSGAFGDGGYDILGPTGNCFGYRTTAAKAGDILELFGVGFGPTTPAVASGSVFSGKAPINSALSLYLNNILVEPTFVGLSGAGLYQINLVLPPGLGNGDIPIEAIIGGMATQKGLMFPFQGLTSGAPVCSYVGDGDGDGGDGGDGDGGDGGDGDGDGGDGDGDGDGG